MWVARDKDNTLRLFPEKPIRREDSWDSMGYNYLYIQNLYNDHEDYDYFNYLSWEDDPIKVNIVTKLIKS